jgi:type IV fimbrial biogenesis protein FimT
MNRSMHRGFSLIELAVVIALIGILASLAIPAFSTLIANGRIRTAAEGMMNGLQVARAEAVRRNTFVDLRFGADGIAWSVMAYASADVPPAPPSILLQTRGAEPNPAVTAALTPAPASMSAVTFGGMGRVVAIRDAGNMPSNPPLTIAIRYTSAVNGSRALCVAVISNTPRLCDPQLPNTDPRACWYNGAPIAGC